MLRMALFVGARHCLVLVPHVAAHPGRPNGSPLRRRLGLENRPYAMQRRRSHLFYLVMPGNEPVAQDQHGAIEYEPRSQHDQDVDENGGRLKKTLGKH